MPMTLIVRADGACSQPRMEDLLIIFVGVAVGTVLLWLWLATGLYY
jgi:hypothetical protein